MSTMSKQIKLKFKKILKKAEFVHADLEYHVELFEDAKKEFTENFNSIVDSLSPEDRAAFNKLYQEVMDKKIADLEKKNQQRKSEEEEDEEEEPTEKGNSNSELLLTEEFPEGIELNVERDDDTPEIKASEMKKIFYRIASATHPDKLAAKKLPPEQVEHSEKLFKRAKEAYETGNWYLLYSLATELSIDTGEIDNTHIDWIEADIRRTMGRIAHMGQLAAWVWYTGNENTRKSVMKNYFKQVYDYELSID